MTVRVNTAMRDSLLGKRTNLISNPSFTTDTTGWTASGASLSAVAGGISGNALQIANSGAAAGSAHQDFATVPGQVYAVSVAFKKGTGAGGALTIGTPASPAELFTGPLLTNSAWPVSGLAPNAPALSAVFVASATTTRITLENTDAAAGTTSFFDDILVYRMASSLRELLKGMFMSYFTGAQPATADTATTATMLVTFTQAGDGVNGLNWGDAANGEIAMGAGEDWRGDAVATGTAGWFRCWVAGDNPANAGGAYPRWDGAIATSGAEINIANASVTAGQPNRLTIAVMVFPE